MKEVTFYSKMWTTPLDSTLTDLTLNFPRSLLKTSLPPSGYPWVFGCRYVTPDPRFRNLVLDHQLLKEPDPNLIKNSNFRVVF